MQGIIASLLALMMTGMVFGQQPQSNNFPLSRPTPAEPLLGRFLLIVDQSVQQTLKEHGFRSANIDESHRENVDHIVFHGSEANSLREGAEPISIQPVPPTDGDEELVFELNDYYLDLLAREGLRYILPARDIGRFGTVTIKYVGNNGLADVAPTSQTQPQFSPTSTLSATPRRSTENRAVPGLPMATSEGSGGYRQTVYGPRLPDNWGQQTGPSESMADSNTFRSGLSVVAQRRQSSVGGQFREDAAPYTLPPDRFASLPSASENPAHSAPANSADRNQSYLATSTYDPILTKKLISQDAENRALDQANQQLADENSLLREKLEEQLYRNQEESIAYGSGSLREPMLRRREYGRQVIVQPPIHTPVTMPERVAVAPHPTGGRMPLETEPVAATANPANPAQPSATDAAGMTGTADPQVLANSELYRKQNAALWFIMLCSIGLNFYLGWIARGFYVRYEELADEIRETFTSSI